MTNLSTKLAGLMDALPGHKGDIDAYIKTLTALNQKLQANLPAIIAALKAAETPLGDVAGLVEKLNAYAKGNPQTPWRSKIELEAADAITALTRQLAERDAEVKRMRVANGILEDALQEAGDDYPGSNMQKWCQQRVKAARQALGGDNG